MDSRCPSEVTDALQVDLPHGSEPLGLLEVMGRVQMLYTRPGQMVPARAAWDGGGYQEDVKHLSASPSILYIPRSTIQYTRWACRRHLGRGEKP